MAGLPHGGVKYAKEGCRCVTCRAGHADYARKAQREKRAALGPGGRNAESRSYYLRNRDRIREYQRLHRSVEATRAGSIRRKARKRGAAGNATTAQMRHRWAYHGGRCWMCGAVADTWDHVKPLSRGGSNWPANLRPACRSCNCSKGVRVVA